MYMLVLDTQFLHQHSQRKEGATCSSSRRITQSFARTYNPIILYSNIRRLLVSSPSPNNRLNQIYFITDAAGERVDKNRMGKYLPKKETKNCCTDFSRVSAILGVWCQETMLAWISVYREKLERRNKNTFFFTSKCICVRQQSVNLVIIVEEKAARSASILMFSRFLLHYSSIKTFLLESGG